MKKLVLTMVALVAMATTSFAQYSDFELMCSKVIDDFYSSSSVPTVSFDLPSVSLTAMDIRPTFQNETYGNHEKSKNSDH